MRERARLTLVEAASHIQRSAPTLSRLETGRAIPRLVDVKALLDHYGEFTQVDGQTRGLVLHLADAAREKEWFTSFSDVLNSDMTQDDVQRFVSYEADAVEIRSFEPDLVPGLLQTRRYAEAVVNLYFPSRTERERMRLLDFRMARQRVLKRLSSPLRLRVVIAELVLRRPVAAHDVMREQGERLLVEMQDAASNVDIRIAPLTLSVPAVIGGPFVVMSLPAGEPEIVYLESREGAQYKQDEATRRRYDALFADLFAAALPRDASVRLVRESMSAWA